MGYATPEQNKAKKERYYASFAGDLNKALNYHFMEARKGAKRRNIDFNLTFDDYKALYEKQQGLCALSGIEMTLLHGTTKQQNPTKISTDRIDNNKGYSKDNIQLIAWQANCAKGTWTTEQLIEMCKNIASRH